MALGGVSRLEAAPRLLTEPDEPNQPRGFPRSTGLARSGFTTLRGALVMPLMTRGYKRGLIKFGLVTAVKPAKR